jgi:hypothetical protein
MNSHRRTFLLTAGAAVLTGPAAHLAKAQGKAKVFLPHASWDCGMKEGLPNPESGSLIFEAQMKLDRLAKIGKTQYGNRPVAVGLEGATNGPRFTGTVMAGALDFELTLSNGTMEVEQIFVFRTGDGKYIYSRNAGVGTNAKDVCMAMDFEAPIGSSSEWMDSGTQANMLRSASWMKKLTL